MPRPIKTISIEALRQYVAANPDVLTVDLAALYAKKDTVDFDALFLVFDAMDESTRLQYIVYLANLQAYALDGTYVVEYDYLDEDWIKDQFEPLLVSHKIDLSDPKHIQKALKGLFARTCLAYKRTGKTITDV